MSESITIVQPVEGTIVRKADESNINEESSYHHLQKDIDTKLLFFDEKSKVIHDLKYKDDLSEDTTKDDSQTTNSGNQSSLKTKKGKGKKRTLLINSNESDISDSDSKPKTQKGKARYAQKAFITFALNSIASNKELEVSYTSIGKKYWSVKELKKIILAKIKVRVVPNERFSRNEGEIPWFMHLKNVLDELEKNDMEKTASDNFDYIQNHKEDFLMKVYGQMNIKDLQQKYQESEKNDNSSKRTSSKRDQEDLYPELNPNKADRKLMNDTFSQANLSTSPRLTDIGQELYVFEKFDDSPLIPNNIRLENDHDDEAIKSGIRTSLGQYERIIDYNDSHDRINEFNQWRDTFDCTFF